MKETLLLILIIGFSYQQCTQGCLKCSATNTCILCDTSNKWYLSNMTCLQSMVTNCQVLTQSNTCASCVSNYYLNPATSLCVAVPAANVVANCATYSGTFSCTSCMGSFYINNGNCMAVTTTVSNCATYSANGVCSACTKGYIFSSNNSQCVTPTAATSCSAYTYGSCRQCKSGFILNANLYLQDLTPTASNIGNLISSLSYTTVQQLSVCQAITVTNCLTYLTFNTCSACMPGFYLSSGSCMENPTPAIRFCATYSSATTCISCLQGYFLSSNSCMAIVAITGCATYSTTASSTQCTACNTGFYVNGNTCAVRLLAVSISNCATYSANADTCATCNSGFMLTSNGLLCYAVVPNCQTYQTWSPGQTSFTCATCMNTFYLNSASPPACIAGTITNCQVYSSSTTCTSCTNGYYLIGSNTCTQHTTITNCSIYSQSQANTCTTCSSGFYLFTYTNLCVAATNPPSNCQRYTPGTATCIACVSEYYLLNNACTRIPIGLTNCVSYDPTVPGACTGCSSTFVLATIAASTSCISRVNYVTTNCDSVLTTASTVPWATSNQLCDVCKQNTIPYVLNSVEAICVLTSDLQTAYPGYGSGGVANCVRYGLSSSGSTLVCMQCASTHVISNYVTPFKTQTAATSCMPVSSCSASTILLDDFFGTVNICLPGSGIMGCQYAGRFTSQANTIADFTCIRATSSHLLSYSVQGNYIYDSVSSTVSTNVVMGAANSVDFDFGYSTKDDLMSNGRPTTFNYRGIPVSPIATTGSSGSGVHTDCDIVFAYSNGLTGTTTTPGPALGSAFGTSMPARLYAQLTVSTYACLRCKFGKEPRFTISGSSGNNAVPTCTDMTNCASAVTVLGGLPSFLNAAFSCHSCSNTPVTTYPTLAIEHDASSSTAKNIFLQYHLRSGTNSGFTCAAAPTPIATTASIPPTGNTVLNCGAYGLFAAQIGNSRELPNPPINICLACSTGYYPTYFSVSPSATITTSGSYIPNYAVTQCTISSNCVANPSSGPFNSCGACSTAQANQVSPVYYAYTDYRLINCLQSSTPNCFILIGSTISSSTANGCSVCMTGYYLNLDGYCDRLTIANADPAATFSPSFFVRVYSLIMPAVNNREDKEVVRIHYLLGALGPQYGVTSCGSNYMLAPSATQALTVCVASAYITNNIALLANSAFVTNCQKYSSVYTTGSTPYSCSMCTSGNMLVAGRRACVASIANCALARTTPNNSQCDTCQTGYFNLNGVCSNTLIANCLNYVNTVTYSTATTMTCLVCNNGYSVTNSGTCVLGQIANCETYMGSSLTDCTSCKTGFMLVTLAGSTKYCYPIPNALTCTLLATSSGGLSGFLQGSITCSSCMFSNPAAPLVPAAWNTQVTPPPQTQCLPFNTVANCVTYDQTSASFASNTFACTSCASGFYLSSTTRVCVTRTLQDANCQTYSPSADQCSVCAAGYFLSSITFRCIANPTGIQFCSVYSNNLTCSACNSGYYLSSNACLQSTAIANCVTYSGNNVCSQCAATYYLTTPISCVLATAMNCLTYTSVSACATCAFGYQLTTTGGTTSCTQIVITNCAVLSLTTPTTCQYCASPYYLTAAGVCTQVTTTISNCLYYASATTCNTCTSGNILSADMATCSTTANTITDTNCDISSILTNAVCTRCDYGYTFQNGACTACSLYAVGCLICDSVNTQNCLVCRPGFYQTSTFSCLANPITTSPKHTDMIRFAAQLLAIMFALLFVR